ncbi:MAG: hypothetical protein HC848_09005 [Limnobacter sp.]|nr:hypothetical protein [Limnobacter sp.]
MKMDTQTRTKLNLLIGNLEAENARLKEELAFFEDFVPGTSGGAVTLKGLQVTKDTVPGQYRYRALVIQGSQKPTVQLKVQILLKMLNQNKPAIMVLPRKQEEQAAQFNLELSRFARVSGVFQVPENNQLESVEMRLMEAGNIKAQTSIRL